MDRRPRPIPDRVFSLYASAPVPDNFYPVPFAIAAKYRLHKGRRIWHIWASKRIDETTILPLSFGIQAANPHKQEEHASPSKTFLHGTESCKPSQRIETRGKKQSHFTTACINLSVWATQSSKHIHLSIWTCTDMPGFTHLSIVHGSTLNSQFQHLRINIQNVADSGYISRASFFWKQHLKSKLQVARVC